MWSTKGDKGGVNGRFVDTLIQSSNVQNLVADYIHEADCGTLIGKRTNTRTVLRLKPMFEVYSRCLISCQRRSHWHVDNFWHQIRIRHQAICRIKLSSLIVWCVLLSSMFAFKWITVVMFVCSFLCVFVCVLVVCVCDEQVQLPPFFLKIILLCRDELRKLRHLWSGCTGYWRTLGERRTYPILLSHCSN